MDIIVKKAVPDDYKDISRLTCELGYAADISETRKWLGYILDSSDHAVFKAVFKNQLSGWIALEKRVTLETGFRVEITGLIVTKELRNKGAGALLIGKAEKWAMEQGIKKIVVSSNVLREESHSFYTGRGFQLRKTSHKYEKKL